MEQAILCILFVLSIEEFGTTNIFVKRRSYYKTTLYFSLELFSQTMFYMYIKGYICINLVYFYTVQIYFAWKSRYISFVTFLVDVHTFPHIVLNGIMCTVHKKLKLYTTSLEYLYNVH